MENSYKGYSLFNDIEDNSLRSWNRCAIAFNLNSMGNKVGMNDYLECLDKTGKVQVMAMIKYIKSIGYDQARINVFGKLKHVGGVQ